MLRTETDSSTEHPITMGSRVAAPSGERSSKGMTLRPRVRRGSFSYTYDGVLRLMKSSLRQMQAEVEAWALGRHRSGRRRRVDGLDSQPLSEGERLLLLRLACLIIPSDGGGPGAAEAGVLETLELRLAHSQPRRDLYQAGLSSFDSCARRQFGRNFLALAASEQQALLHRMERLSRAGTGGPMRRLLGEVRRLYFIARLPAVGLVPNLIGDVMEAFYTSQSGWAWLRFDGPPMPLGYPDPVNARL
jgi:hypothetical protein